MAYTTIDDPSAHFQVNAYSGSSNPQTITNGGNSDLQPDFLWSKRRDSAAPHYLFDSNRGVNSSLSSDDTDAEDTATGYLASFNSDGFTTGSDSALAYSGRTYVAWQWKANGGTVANDTNGDITTSVQANQTAGFSIATYTGNGGSDQTLGHGLGAEPDFVIFKDRDSSSAWRIFVRLLGASKFLNLNTTDAANTSTNIFPSHSSTTIGVEQNDVMNKNSSDHIMYSFRSIQGYSKIGSYTGNGNADGPFVYLGFKPAWVMVKRTNTTGAWEIYDSARNGNDSNPINDRLRANDNAAENSNDSSDYVSDFLSNGWKIRTNSGNWNTSGHTYIYMAFAEHPFVSSKGVPVTAR